MNHWVIFPHPLIRQQSLPMDRTDDICSLGKPNNQSLYLEKFGIWGHKEQGKGGMCNRLKLA